MSTSSSYVINGIALAEPEPSGIPRNAFELLLQLDKLESPEQMAVLVPQGTNINSFPFSNIKVVVANNPSKKTHSNLLWNQIIFPRYVKKTGGIGIDLTLSLPVSGCQYGFIYDCITERFPEDRVGIARRIGRALYLKRVAYALNHYIVVFTDSEYAKSDIIAHYGCDPDKIVVIYCAWQHMLRVGQDDSVLGRLGLEDGRYFFSLGSRYPHKNFRWVESAARQNPRYRFVVTGADKHVPEAGGEGAPSNLTFTGYLSDEEVKALEAHCRAFLHPSLYEGFGMPPMEAMSVGARCVVSNVTALPEVYGDSVWYIDPTDYEHIDLDEIMSRPLKGTNEDVLSRFSWEKSARDLLSALGRL